MILRREREAAVGWLVPLSIMIGDRNGEWLILIIVGQQPKNT
jgi:hypothetical protein